MPTHIRYSYLFCEVCETNYRQFLCKFTDGSVFTLCGGCVDDLALIVETFLIDVAISAFSA